MNQIEYVKEMLSRDFSNSSSSIKLKDGVVIDNLQSLLNIEWSDWEMEYNFNKTPFKTKRPKRVA